MKNIASILILFPAFAMASGGDVLLLMWLEAGLFIIVLVFIFFINLKFKCKILIFVSYLISTYIALFLTSGIPYSQNIILVNSISIIVPLLGIFMTWKWCIHNKKEYI